MPRLIVTQRAIEGLERCRRFLSRKTPEASRRAAQVIDQHFRALEATPAIGRPIEATPGLRELVIPFGDTGYVALYLHPPGDDTLYVLAFRHQRELGY
ncbi:type II toxin-antitoxin system RelE/ParE family toxin [Paraburkholderia tropica]|uniref:type II toxin-antitoxin system RelE/ParE family toxin n=1 Tax=Paraburkholderia tropica TaxID=92647 RepID=UPI0009F22253|nr:type II toxin-antitoxin system RelE/ParE family toxin [Paraburkholderia tropica]MBB2979432.1 plasmid stabilization system protein ParE [Paraburkholderia tropica]